MLYSNILKPVLFRMDAEKAHDLTINGLGKAGNIPAALAMLEQMYGIKEQPFLAQDLWGIHFASPIGLAAGLDKNGKAIPGFSSIGFGFIEVGTVTPVAQPGNDQPRLFRLPEDQALINRMGFNNLGSEALASRLRRLKLRKIPVAVNIGKNKWTPNERAEEDYKACIRTLYGLGSFFVVNISSPNTPGLRNLQHGDELRKLLDAVMSEMKLQNDKTQRALPPVLVKIAPDVQDPELEYMMEIIVKSGVSGVIATNTTLSRAGLTHAHAKETGGLSGKPLAKRSTDVIRQIYRLTQGKLPIIGCGGIFNSEDAYEKIRAGASLVEIYTALIYQGPSINRMLYKGMGELLRRDGFTHISQAIGVDA